MKVLGVIPARGGSKGIPRKNVRELGGKPLLAWTIQSALGAQCVVEVVVSTDDDEIVRVARKFGASVPFLRPKELATDESSSAEVLLHVCQQLPQFEWLLLLQPTSPFRTSTDIAELVSLVERLDAPAGISVREASEIPEWMFRMEPTARMTPIFDQAMPTRRQAASPAYVPNGAMYLIARETLISEQVLFPRGWVGYVMPESRSIDIDNDRDWERAVNQLTGGMR